MICDSCKKEAEVIESVETIRKTILMTRAEVRDLNKTHKYLDGFFRKDVKICKDCIELTIYKNSSPILEGLNKYKPYSKV